MCGKSPPCLFDSMNQMQCEGEMQRFEWWPDGTLAGFVDYYRFGEIVIITHTETSPTLAGGGHGSRLADAALRWMSEQNWRVVPVCGFMAHFVRTHPQHHDVVSPAARAIFGIDTGQS